MAKDTKAKRQLGVLAVASFLNDMGSDIIYPIWPFFVTVVMGANTWVLGALDGLGDAIVSISKAGAGYASDRIERRKPFIWSGYFFGSLSRVGYALAASWPWLFPFRVLDRAGKIRSAPRDAMVADMSDDSNRGWHFGVLRAMDNFGAVVGIMISLLLIDVIGYRNLFLLAALPSLLAVLLIVLFVKEKAKGVSKAFKGLHLRDISPDFRLLLLSAIILTLGTFSYSFLLLFAHDAGFSIGTVPAFYLLFTIVAALASMPFGWMMDRVGRKASMFFSYGLWALTCASAVLLGGSLVSVLAIFILFGLFKGTMEVVQKTMVSEMAPPDLKASHLGAFQMAVGLSALPASFTAGILWDVVGPTAPFFLALVLTGISAAVFAFVKVGRGPTPLAGQ